MNLLEGLNPEQKAAVEHTDGPMLVVAGAGTGKTQVITRRIAHLIASEKALPKEVLALTFTEKAAREMAERLHGLIGWDAFQVPVLTFNAFGAELLARYGSHVGRSVRGGLINNTQKTLLLQQHISDVSLSYYGSQSDLYAFLEGVVNYIEKLQNADISPERYEAYVAELRQNPEGKHPADVTEQEDLAKLYGLYERVKTTTGTYDYHDQLALPLRILRERPNLAERLKHQYRYVLVDEYQDTSPVQDALLRMFVEPGGNIFAVGDDDQGIYSFRGADIDNILSFTDHFQGVKPLALIQNYRSGQPILDAAYRLICHNNPERLESRLGINKRLVAQTSEATADFVPYRTRPDEQQGVIAAIQQRIADGEAPSSLAVLSRSNAVLKIYAKLLREAEIPFALSTEVNIFEQKELIHLWYLLEWLGGRANDESCTHVTMGPFLQMPAESCRRYTRNAKEALCSFETALEQAAGSGDEEAARIMQQLGLWREWARELPVSQLCFRLVFETGLSERLMRRAGENHRVVRVFEDLHRLFEQMQDYETVALDPTLSGYLQIFPKPPALEVTEAVGSEDGVQLLTVHASKGLEFDTVFVVNCTQKSWSPQGQAGLKVPEELLRVTKEADPIHEQRRLMYVAATRARTNLILSAPLQTEAGAKQTVSSLITELFDREVPEPPKAERIRDEEKMMQRLQRFYPLKPEAGLLKLPFAADDGWLNLGVGALHAYERCPHEFFLQYVLGIAQPFGPHLAFGTAIHGVIQAYYEACLRGEEITWGELEMRFAELWTERGYATPAAAEAARSQALAALKSFLDREKFSEHRILGCETKISFEIPEARLRLSGRIDAYFETREGIEIRDFKTGQKRDAEKLAAEAKKNFQLRTYALAFEALNGKAPSSVVLDYVVTGTQGEAVLTPLILKKHREKLISLAERIRAGDFAPAARSEFHECAAFKYYGADEDEDGL